MGKITCVVIEDERPAQEILRSYILKMDWLELRAVFEDAVTAMEYLRKHEIDLIFLDIQIPTVNGIEFLKIFKEHPQVIITSAYSEYALDAFELDVRDYLKKPFSFERFLRAINRISMAPEPGQIHDYKEKNVTDHSFAFFNVNKTMVKVYFDDIRYVESMREYIYLHTTKGKVVTKMSTHEIEKLLGGSFLRVHRSFIINISRVTAFNAEDVFIDEIAIPIGVSYKRHVEGVFRKHAL